MFIPEIEKTVNGSQIERFKSEFKQHVRTAKHYSMQCTLFMLVPHHNIMVHREFLFGKALNIPTTQSATLIGFIWLSTSMS